MKEVIGFQADDVGERAAAIVTVKLVEETSKRVVYGLRFGASVEALRSKELQFFDVFDGEKVGRDGIIGEDRERVGEDMLVGHGLHGRNVGVVCASGEVELHRGFQIGVSEV